MLGVSRQMGAEIGALAISHLEEVSEEGISAMAKSGTVGVLLPTTAYNLRLTPPPARAMIQGGMAVALGSDFNPNAHCVAMVRGGFVFRADSGDDGDHDLGDDDGGGCGGDDDDGCLLYTSPSPRDSLRSRMPSSA